MTEQQQPKDGFQAPKTILARVSLVARLLLAMALAKGAIWSRHLANYIDPK